MKKLKTVLNILADIIEIYLPSLLFFLLFVFYVLMIAYRYVFHKQFNDIFELSVVLFLWCSLLSASYGGRSGKHIMFTILYDTLSETPKMVFRIISNLFIVVIFMILVPYAYECLAFSARKATSILKISYTIVNLPIISLIGLTLIYYTNALAKDIIKIFGLIRGRDKL